MLGSETVVSQVEGSLLPRGTRPNSDVVRLKHAVLFCERTQSVCFKHKQPCLRAALTLASEAGIASVEIAHPKCEVGIRRSLAVPENHSSDPV